MIVKTHNKTYKRSILTTFITCLLLALVYLSFQIYQKSKIKKAFAEQVKFLPAFSDFEWINKQAPTNTSETILFFFHPSCEHCQYEVRDILKNREHFSKVNLCWISTADTQSIQKFSNMYGLDSLNNSYLAHISDKLVFKTFGSISVPHIFIYNKSKSMEKEFKGETKVEAILKYVKNN